MSMSKHVSSEDLAKAAAEYWKTKLSVQQFIEFGTDEDEAANETYARYVLMHLNLPATMKYCFTEFTKELKLFAKYKGQMYRVTLASSMGDIGLSLNFDSSTGYTVRVLVEDIESWHKTPEG